VWKINLVALASIAALCPLVFWGAAWGGSTTLNEDKGEYRLEIWSETGTKSTCLPQAEGKALMERMTNPAHMAVTGFGENSNATLRAGDDTKNTAFGVLGPAKPLPEWRRCKLAFGYISARPGDNTVLLMDMCNTCQDNKEYAASLFVGLNTSTLPKEYRQHVKRFAPSTGVHAELATQSGLKLGMARAEVEEALGKPLWKEKNTFHYQTTRYIQLSSEFLISRWQWPKDVEPKLGGDYHSITVWFVGGRVSAFELAKLYDL
jgi:hypothetical protein